MNPAPFESALFAVAVAAYAAVAALAVVIAVTIVVHWRKW